MPINLIPYLQQLLLDELPFLMLRTAGSSTVRVLSQKDQKLYNKPHDKLAYGVISKFHNVEGQFFIYGEEEERFTYVDPGDLNLESSTFPISDAIEAQKNHVQLVEKAIVELQTTSLKKVVLSRKQHFENHKSDLELIQQLLLRYTNANCYFFDHPKLGKWMGATPEVLLEINGGRLSTMSLAGTAVFKEEAHHVWGLKELEEQQLVTNFIKDQLAVNGADSVTVSSVQTVRAGSLLHLQTDINAIISFKDADRYVEALHPTPAVCGLPRDRAMRFIIENEQYDRSFYTGYLGIVDTTKEQARYFVNLRCMEIHDTSVTIYVGGGITALSDAAAEFEETLNKLQTMLQVVGTL